MSEISFDQFRQRIKYYAQDKNLTNFQKSFEKNIQPIFPSFFEEESFPRKSYHSYQPERMTLSIQPSYFLYETHLTNDKFLLCVKIHVAFF
jgi:hypothetical protein